LQQTTFVLAQSHEQFTRHETNSCYVAYIHQNDFQIKGSTYVLHL
jgi:hypothetical protein